VDRSANRPRRTRPGRAPRLRAGGLALLIGLTLGSSGGAAAPAASPATAATPTSAERLELNHEIAVHVRRGRDLELEVRAPDGATWEGLARRFAGRAEVAGALAAWNGDREPSARPTALVPLALLDDAWRAIVLRNLFPEDRWEAGALVHVAGRGRLPTYAAGLWQVAEWFTGRGDNFVTLMEVNRLDSPEIRTGQEIRVPAELVRPGLADAGARSDDGSLVYGDDERGPYAGYRLKAGEALYSAVVVRFTGRTSSDDVVALAASIAERSGIPDLTDIPVGFLVKIPLDELDPVFLPAEHPRRVEFELERTRMAESLAATPVPTASGLGGVVVVLDPGHGGKDLGTQNNGVWEHDYVYDVAVRLKALLERHSTARVHMTLKDLDTGWTPSSGDRVERNLQGTILTDPPFLARENGEARIGVNLRWYLANSIHRREVAGGTDPDRVVFLSLHADALHPSLRGAMVYVPGASLRTRTYHHSGPAYDRYREVREKPTVKFPYKSRIRSEAVSRKLAGAVLDGFRSEGLPVHDDRPVRDRIVRGRATFVPAVIRGNEIPAKVLVEMVNLGNRDDARLLGSSADRERMARALARGLFAYFGESAPPAMASR